MLMRPAVALSSEGTVGIERIQAWLGKFSAVRDWALEVGELHLAEQLQQALEELARRKTDIDRQPIAPN
jgi:hypothetical protein